MGPTSDHQGILSVGISDLIAHRECPRRAAYGARRHTGEEGLQNHGLLTPEAGSPATWYGSAIHDAIDASEDGLDDDAAIEHAWATWGRHLEPSDLQLLKADLELYHTRDFENVRTVLNEGEIKAFLTTMPDGREVWFRARIDRLYECLDAPEHMIHVDYKSSKYQKTQNEVDEDKQLRAYNWIIHEVLDVSELDQYLDQLRGGMMLTRESDEDRLEMREWLEINARAYFTEREAEMQPDGLPLPQFNQWCPWCFPASTPVLTPGGQTQAIGTLAAGDDVVAADGTNRKVLAVASRPASSLVTVRTYGAPPYRMTPGHPLLAGNGPDREWINAEDLRKGDIVWAHLPTAPRRQVLTTDEQQILGWYLAEGDSGARSVSFSLHTDERNELSQVHGLLERVFESSHFETRTRKGSASLQTYLHDHHAASWFRHFGGKHSNAKRIHPLVFGDGSGIFEIALAAWRGDGTTPHERSYQTSYTTTSLTLATQIQIILLREGFKPIWGTREPHRFAKGTRDLGFRQRNYTLTLNGEDTMRLASHLGTQAFPTRHPKASKCSVDGEWIGYQVAEVFSEPCDEDVYDIQVEGSESFQLPGMFGVHNCPILESCQIIPHLTEWALARIDVLRPEDLKSGEAATPIDEYMDRYDDVNTAVKVLERYLVSVKELVHLLPESERLQHGFDLRGRNNSFIPTHAYTELYEALGHDRFMELVSITQEKLKSTFTDKESREWALSLVEKRSGNPTVQRRRVQ